MQEPLPKPDSLGERLSGGIIKVLGSLLALIIAFAVLGAIKRDRSPNLAPGRSEYSDETVAKGLAALADKINEGLPMMVDEGTRADSVTAGPRKKLTYNMTLVSIAPSDISAAKLREQLEEDLRQKICTSDDVSGLRSDGVIWSYKYHDNSGGVIGEILIYPEDCAQQSK